MQSVSPGLLPFLCQEVRAMYRIGLINIGLGNIGSIQNMLSRLGYEVAIVRKPSASLSFDLLILPGVGSFDYGITRLREAKWDTYLNEAATKSHPRMLGICLGMQMLCEGSEEGALPGLNLIPGHFVRIDGNNGTLPFSGNSLKVPHMGWNEVEYYPDKAAWVGGLSPNQRYYFVHSYRYSHNSNEHVVGVTNYGETFGVVVQKGNVIGVQFHPEKSHRFGMDFLRAVVEHAKC